MKTEIVMKRELFGHEVRQKSQSEFFSATDLVKAGNKWRLLNDKSIFNLGMWLKTDSSLEFITELKNKYGQVVYKGRGRNSCTWVHPLLFIDIALGINPKLKIEVYEWLFDNLIKSRNNSGDSYKQMCGSLYVRHGNKQTFHKYITQLAIDIKNKCKVQNWEEATENQLKLRDKLHYDISLLSSSLNNNNEAVRLVFLNSQNKIG